MAEKLLIAGVEISTFAFATEDIDKVEQAIRNILPKGFNTIFKQIHLKGHYNDPITAIQLKFKRRREASAILEHLIKGLSSLDIHQLKEEIENRVDHTGNLYIRLDKQRAFKGVEVLNRVDPIRIKIKFSIPHKQKPAIYILSVLEALEVVK